MMWRKNVWFVGVYAFFVMLGMYGTCQMVICLIISFFMARFIVKETCGHGTIDKYVFIQDHFLPINCSIKVMFSIFKDTIKKLENPVFFDFL
ncbi:MAG: hypothetical protein ACP5F6_00110 [Microbacter sp.]